MTTSTDNISKSDMVRGFLSFLEREVSTSRMALNSGVHTNLTADLEKYFTNPLEALIESSASVDKNIQKMVVTIFDSFLKSQKEVISCAYKHIDKNILHYFLVLNKDNFENRDIFFQFLDQYESLGIDHKLPAHFQFLPKTEIGKNDSLEELNLEL